MNDNRELYILNTRRYAISTLTFCSHKTNLKMESLYY